MKKFEILIFIFFSVSGKNQSSYSTDDVFNTGGKSITI